MALTVAMKSGPQLSLQTLLSANELSEREKERLKQIQEQVNMSMEMLDSNRKAVDASSKECERKTEEITQYCTRYACELAVKVCSGNLKDIDPSRGRFLMQLGMETNKRYFETHAQLMHISQMSNAIVMRQDKRIMETFLLEKMHALDAYTEQIKQIIEGENHALEMEMIVMQQQMKEETQKFDQLLHRLEFTEQEKKQRLERERIEREQNRLDDDAYQKLAAERAEIINMKK